MQARAVQELTEIAEHRLAAVMADTATPAPGLAAALTVAAVRAVFLPHVLALLAGEPAPDPERYAQRLAETLDAVDDVVRRLGGR